jgi:hypothetical protein
MEILSKDVSKKQTNKQTKTGKLTEGKRLRQTATAYRIL